MIILRRLAAFAAVAVSACAPAVHSASQAPVPSRTSDSEVSEIRTRHNDIIDAFRENNIDKITRQLAPDAILVLQSRDTVRGPAAIGLEVDKLFKAFKIESFRATAAARVVQCMDGIIERTGDWSLQILKPDKSRDFKRDAFGVRWKSVGDSLKISLITLVPRGGLTNKQANCTSVDEVRLAGSRMAIFATMGVQLPSSYTASAEHAYGKLGFGAPNIGDPTNYPEGILTNAPEIVGIAGRLTDKLWISTASPYHTLNLAIGVRNVATRTYVGINRLHFPIALNLDYHWKGWVIGAGPALAKDHLFYQEIKTDGACPGGSGAGCPLNLIDRNENHIGQAGSISYNMEMGPHAALVGRYQLFRFPTQTMPALTARPGDPVPDGSAAVAIRDLTGVFGLGLRISY